MSRARRLGPTSLLALLVLLLIAAGCGAGADRPTITQVRPATGTPGELLMVSGRNFDKADVVWINGQPATRVTWVNDRLLTAVVPLDLPTGAYPLEVRSIDGERAAVSLNVGSPGSARPPAVAQPAPNPAAPTSPPAAAPATASTPQPQAATTPPPSAPPAIQAAPPRQPSQMTEKEREQEKERIKKEAEQEKERLKKEAEQRKKDQEKAKERGR